MAYRHARTSVSLINRHFVWTPKYRRHVLVGSVKACLEKVRYEPSARSRTSGRGRVSEVWTLSHIFVS